MTFYGASSGITPTTSPSKSGEARLLVPGSAWDPSVSITSYEVHVRTGSATVHTCDGSTVALSDTDVQSISFSGIDSSAMKVVAGAGAVDVYIIFTYY